MDTFEDGESFRPGYGQRFLRRRKKATSKLLIFFIILIVVIIIIIVIVVIYYVVIKGQEQAEQERKKIEQQQQNEENEARMRAEQEEQQKQEQQKQEQQKQEQQKQQSTADNKPPTSEKTNEVQEKRTTIITTPNSRTETNSSDATNKNLKEVTNVPKSEFVKPTNLSTPWTTDWLAMQEFDFPVKAEGTDVLCYSENGKTCKSFMNDNWDDSSYWKEAKPKCTAQPNGSDCRKLKNRAMKQIIIDLNRKNSSSTLKCDVDNKNKNNGNYNSTNSWCDKGYEILFNKNNLINALKSPKELSEWQCLQDKYSNNYYLARKIDDGNVQCNSVKPGECLWFNNNNECNSMLNMYNEIIYKYNNTKDPIQKALLTASLGPAQAGMKADSYDDPKSWMSTALKYL